ncbi:MAG TPA: ice-binding family protein [Anaerolineales bacterium]|nr:ice-binding family protein [Anaerolineales bacterium]
MHKLKFLTISIIMLLLFSAASPSTGISARPLAQTAPGLGAAGTYSVLSAAGVTDVVNGSNFNGDVGSAGPTTDIIATQVSAPGVLNPPTVAQALLDGASAWLALSTPPQPAGTPLSLAGAVSVTPGVYDLTSNFTGGTLTINGPGVYIFRSASNLTDPGNSTVTLVGADPCNIFWQVVANISFGANSTMVGTFISQTATIAFANGTTLNGRAIALGAGQVTLDNNTFTTPVCATTTATGGEEDNTVRGLPNTGGAPIQNGDFPWSLAILGGISAIALGLRAYRRNQLPK